MADSGTAPALQFRPDDDRDIPSLGALALRYGTISQKQYDRAMGHVNRETARGQKIHFGQTLINQGSATASQISLLTLIREFLILRKQGEKFGQIAVEKGFAKPEEVNWALEIQKKEFKRAKLKRLVGDLLVEAGVITPDQRDLISREQKRLEQEIDQTFQDENFRGIPDSGNPDGVPDPVNLSDHEKEYLRLRALDQQFADDVVARNFASREQVDQALEMQATAFRELEKSILLGDILVSNKVLTSEQRDEILFEQRRLQAHRTDAEALPPETAKTARPEKKHASGPISDELPPATILPRVTVRISQDNLEAWVAIEPPNAENAEKETGPLLPLTDASRVREAIKNKGIVEGIFPDRLLAAHLAHGDSLFLAALGTAPIPEDRPTEIYHFPKAGNGTDSNPANPFLVKKGEALAEPGPPGSPAPGRTIFGQPADAGMKRPGDMPMIYRCASGARFARDSVKAFAAKTGIPHLSIDRKLFVFPTVHILEDADFRYGPIDPYSEIAVTGILTGAYPVRAGSIRATEIRGADIEALGSIRVDIGITNATIRTQGSIHARYIHNSTIHAFGDITVDHEILDSRILTSGRCLAVKSRIINSTVSARGGVQAGGIGSDVTEPCIITVGREDLLVSELHRITGEIRDAGEPLERLSENRNELSKKATALFNKMVRLKVFHDRAKKQKRFVENNLETEPPKAGDEEKKTRKLLDDLTAKMNSILASLKELNKKKKNIDRQRLTVDNRISRLKPTVDKTIAGLEADRYALIDWALDFQGESALLVTGPIAQGTRINGISSSLVTSETLRNRWFKEIPAKDDPGNFIIEVTDPPQGWNGHKEGHDAPAV